MGFFIFKYECSFKYTISILEVLLRFTSNRLFTYPFNIICICCFVISRYGHHFEIMGLVVSPFLRCVYSCKVS